jgi:hypothetical protein
VTEQHGDRFYVYTTLQKRDRKRVPETVEMEVPDGRVGGQGVRSATPVLDNGTDRSPASPERPIVFSKLFAEC